MTMQPEFFSAWVRWHGPFRSVKKWRSAAEKFGANPALKERVRLYLAIGRCKKYSIRAPELQYIGLNARDSGNTLLAEIDSAISRKSFHGLLNEYWLGELLTQFFDVDTHTNGLTKNTERSLIYSLDPLQNHHGFKSAPVYSFRVVNSLCDYSKLGTILRSRFPQLVPSYIEYDAKKQLLIHGNFKITRKSSVPTAKIKRKKVRQKITEVKCWLKQRFESEPFAQE